MNPDGDRQLRTMYQRSRTTISARMDRQTVASIKEKKLKSCPLDMTINMVKAKSLHSPTRTPYSLAKAAKNCVPKRGQIKLVSSLTKQLPKKRESNKCKKNNAEGSNFQNATLHSTAEHEAILKKFLSTEIDDADVLNCPQREGAASMYQLMIGSDLAEEMEFRSLEEEHSPALKFGKEEMEIYKGLERQEYDVAPCQELLVVALDKVKDYLIAGHLANSLSKDSVTERLSDDIMNTLCVPKNKVLHSEKFLDDFKRKLRKFAAKSNDTAECISVKMNHIIKKYRGGIALPRRNSEDLLLKEQDASKMLCQKLAEELKSYMTDIMVDMKPLLKQHQLLCQLETQIRSKLEGMTLEYKTNARLKLQIKLQIENSPLLQEVEACQCTIRTEHDSIKDTNNTKEHTEASGELKSLNQAQQEDKRTSKARFDVECRDQFQGGATEQKVVEMARPSQETLAEEQVFKSRCAALEDRIADMTRRSKEDDDAHEARVKLLQEDTDNVKERLMVEISLREECEKKLEEDVERSDAQLSHLIKLNDPRYRHPYPRRDAGPSDMKMAAWLDMTKAYNKLNEATAKVVTMRAERDKVLNIVSKFLVSKHIVHNDPDVQHVVMNKATVEALEGDVKRLTCDLEERSTEENRWKKKVTCLEATLNSIEDGADAVSSLRENYFVKERVQTFTGLQQDVVKNNQNIDTLLCRKISEIEQRDRFMSAQCEAHEARERLLALLARRQEAAAPMTAKGRGQRQTRAEDRDVGARYNGSPTSVMSLLSALGSRISKFMRYGNPPSSPPSQTAPSN